MSAELEKEQNDLKRLNEIRDYVVTKYPECCLSINYDGFKFEDVGFIPVLTEELSNFFWCEYMNLCGCGDPEQVQEVIKKYLNVVRDHFNEKEESNRDSIMKQTFEVEYVYDNSLLLFLAYVLDSYEFTNHGSSVGGAFITDLGRMYLDVLTIHLKEE